MSEPRLPAEPGDMTPAHTRMVENSRIRGSNLIRVDACGRCHPDVVAQWSTSAHAWTSFNNPVYRVSIDGFRERVSQTASRFCAGCHDVALLVDGAMDAPIAADDMRAHAGINCRVCHGVVETRKDGNGSYTLGENPISVPDGDDPASIERHRRAVTVRHLGSDLCLTCHRSFVGPETGNPNHLAGMDDSADWQRSAHAAQGVARVDSGVPARDCVDCHMDKESVSPEERAAKDGQVSSHRFLGAHTWLAKMRADSDQEARLRERLRGVASIDIAAAISRQGTPARAADGDSDAPGDSDASGDSGGPNDPDDTSTAVALSEIRTLPADNAPVYPGGTLLLDVVVRNLTVGHRFPGGVKDAQDVWLEVTVRDARDRVVARSGHEHADHAHDTEAHVLRALLADEHGDVLLSREVSKFRALIVDHTIAPRDVAVVRYALDVPGEAAAYEQPFSATATLHHRSRNLILQENACAAARSEIGQAFARASVEARGQALDPCVEQPVTTIAETRVWLGRGAAERASATSRADWLRLYEHGMAWTHAVQERLEEARPSLLAALAELRAQPDSKAQDRAMVMAALGRLAGRQGRADEALEWLDRADALLPGHPALASIRGAALTQVWRWREAEAPLTLAARAMPKNAGAWADLAVALGSLGKEREALNAARHGLKFEPRHPDLLRVQALSVRAQGNPTSERALDAYDRFRKPDEAMDIRFACTAKAPECAREREPVHVHHMVADTTAPATQ